MVQINPTDLEFMMSSLNKEQKAQALQWYRRLSLKDRETSYLFLRRMHDILDLGLTVAKSLDDDWVPYVSMSAIGSSTRQGEQPKDLDFLILTNLIWRDVIDPTKSLRYLGYSVSADPSPSKNYESGSPRKRDAILEIRSPKGIRISDKKIHLTIQAQVIDEMEYSDVEKESAKGPRVLLYHLENRFGF